MRDASRVNHGLCYCLDCQAFAHFLGRPGEVLDAQGGTEIVQTASPNVAITSGVENLACMRLTTNGLMRWHTRCCSTPIGNTSASWKLPFVGLIHSCLRSDATTLDDSFGPVSMRVYTKHAKGDPKPRMSGGLASAARFASMMFGARASGRYKTTPFFAADTGAPIVTPHVLNDRELNDLRSAVGR